MPAMRAVCAHDCPDQCSLSVTVEDGRIRRIEGDPDHPFTDGFICAKVAREHELVHSAERLTTPLRRRGAKGSGDFEPVPWDAALDEIAGRWRAIIAESGPAALCGYAYSAHQGKANRLLPMGLFEALGATRMRTGTVCDSTAGAAWTATLGPVGGTDPEAVLDSDLVVAWGADLVTTNVHFWTLVQKARKKGARLIVVDPRRSRTAVQADWHIRIPIGGDAALALGVMHALVRDGRCDRAWLAAHAHGFDRFESEILPEWPPAAVAERTGIGAAEIERLAAAIGGARAPFFRLGHAPSRNRNGGAAIRAVALLPGVVGAYGRPGGGAQLAANTSASLNLAPLARPTGRPAPREVDHARLGRALLDLADPPIRALFVAATNPAVTSPDTGRVRRGLMREDLFTVVHAPFLSETARFADLVLPATTYLETEDIYASYGGPWLQYAPAVIPPVGGARSNADLARDLAHRMGIAHPLFWMSDRELAEFVLEGAPVDRDAVLSGEPVRVPECGPLFATPSGRLDFWPEGLPPLGWAAESGTGLRLLTAPGHFVSHTAFEAVPFLRARQGESILSVHPDEAARRGLAEGDAVEAFNETGSARFTLRVSDEVGPGVALVTGLLNRVNDLCPDAEADLAEGAVFQSTWLELRHYSCHSDQVRPASPADL